MIAPLSGRDLLRPVDRGRHPGGVHLLLFLRRDGQGHHIRGERLRPGNRGWKEAAHFRRHQKLALFALQLRNGRLLWTVRVQG